MAHPVSLLQNKQSNNNNNKNPTTAIVDVSYHGIEAQQMMTQCMVFDMLN